MNVDVISVATAISEYAAQVRAIAQSSGRIADFDAAYQLEHAVSALRRADRRLAALRAEQAAAEVVASRRRSAF